MKFKSWNFRCCPFFLSPGPFFRLWPSFRRSGDRLQSTTRGLPHHSHSGLLHLRHSHSLEVALEESGSGSTSGLPFSSTAIVLFYCRRSATRTPVRPPRFERCCSHTFATARNCQWCRPLRPKTSESTDCRKKKNAKNLIAMYSGPTQFKK